MTTSEVNETVFSMEDIATADGTRYKVVNAHGGKFRIGTLSTAHVMDWVERRKDPGPNAKLAASMFLIVRSLVFGSDPATYTRVPDDRIDAEMNRFKMKDDTGNGKLVDAILLLNEMVKNPEQALAEKRGNDSGEVTSDASPTV